MKIFLLIIESACRLESTRVTKNTPKV